MLLIAWHLHSTCIFWALLLMPVVSTCVGAHKINSVARVGWITTSLSELRTSATLQISISKCVQNLLRDVPSVPRTENLSNRTRPTNCCCFITNAPSSSHSQVRNLEVRFPLPHKPSSVSPIYSLLRVSRFRCPRLQLCSQKPSKWPPFSALVHLPPFSSCSYKCLEDRPGCAYSQLIHLLPARARSRPSQAGRNTAAWPLHPLISPRVLIATPKTIYIPGFPSLNIVSHPVHLQSHVICDVDLILS